MEHIINDKAVTKGINSIVDLNGKSANLSEAIIDKEYVIKDVVTDDEAMKDFLFTLGCYKGERVTVISNLSGNYVVSLKDARYSIDKELAEAIII